MADIHKNELLRSCYTPSLPMFVIITKNIKISNLKLKIFMFNIIHVIMYIVGDSMRKQVEYYNGKKITPNVLHRINLIDSKRIQEGITKFSIERPKGLKSLCKFHETTPENEHIILGEDWYIIYTELSEEEIDIKDWIAIHNVENKLTQTMEMYNALKNILLKYQDYNINSILRHSTSYPFYKKLLNDGYIEEGYDLVDLDDCTPELEQIRYQIFLKYDSLEDYLKDENRDKYENIC